MRVFSRACPPREASSLRPLRKKPPGTLSSTPSTSTERSPLLINGANSGNGGGEISRAQSHLESRPRPRAGKAGCVVWRQEAKSGTVAGHKVKIKKKTTQLVLIILLSNLRKHIRTSPQAFGLSKTEKPVARLPARLRGAGAVRQLASLRCRISRLQTQPSHHPLVTESGRKVCRREDNPSKWSAQTSFANGLRFGFGFSFESAPAPAVAAANGFPFGSAAGFGGVAADAKGFPLEGAAGFGGGGWDSRRGRRCERILFC